MKDKVGILNFQYSNHNYGAVLQAAALEYSIKKLGYEVEHINLIPSLQLPQTAFSRLKTRLVSIKRYIFPSKKNNKIIHNENIFEEFRQKWITRTRNTYSNLHDLEKNIPNYNYVIVGSDQVWRPIYTRTNALAYFLSFIPDSCRRISYAASFGVDYWAHDNDVELTDKIANELKKFYAISVRESSSVKLCKDIFGVKAIHVLDPTLLIGRHFFDNIIKQSTHREACAELVYYKLDIDKKFKVDIDILATKYNYSIENIYHQNIDGELHYNPVSEWLEKLRESSLVITDSFHCVCFSILFEKQFIYYENNARGMARLNSLLSSLDLSNRVCVNTENFSSTQLFDDVIDYSKVNKLLRKLRDDSYKFLKESLR